MLYSDINFQAGEKSLSELVYESDSIQQSLYMIFTTKRGSRLFRPDFGCDLERYLFTPITETNRHKLEAELRYGMEQEVRIEISNLKVITDMSLPGYVCTVFYRIPLLNKTDSLNFLLKKRL